MVLGKDSRRDLGGGAGGRYSQWWFVEGMSLFPPAWGSALPGWTEDGGETLPLYAWALG